jgi:hypothetical protein
MSDERRQFHRISFDAPVSLSQGSIHALSEVIDVSLKGILIKGNDLPFDFSKPVKILIKLGQSVTIERGAEHAHQKDSAHGFQLTHLDIESMTHLRRLLELNTGDDALLDRELAMLCAG